jgi:hypothetical protein
LEQEARERAVIEKARVEKRLEERRQQVEKTGKKFGGSEPKVPDPDQAKPEPTEQRNFTDPESRIMMDGATKSYTQAYNAQLAVDSHAQIIVAATLTQAANDQQQLVPVLNLVEQNMGRKPEQATADTGYFSEAAVADQTVTGIELLVPPKRQKQNEEKQTGQAAVENDTAAAQPQSETVNQGTPPPVKSAAETMREKLQTAAGKAVYKMRKAVVEPVFGQIKAVRGFRGFSMRGLEKTSAEWQIVCLTHNLLKLFRAGLRLQAA